MSFFTVSRNFRDEVVPNAEGLVSAEVFFPVQKFDERTGRFEAWSTVEEIDNHREICDVEKSWPALVKWSETISDLSGGKSVGNLRIQHRRDTIGGQLTLMERRDRDGKPGVYVEGLISDETAKADTAAGRITGLSARGLTKKWADPDNPGVTRYAFVDVEEKSLCDRPAVPHALIEVLKSDGGVEMVQATGRTIAQFWDCGVEGCTTRHALKGEAVKCEGVASEVAVPRRVEAKVISAEVSKSLWHVSDAIAVLSGLLCLVDNKEYEETWEAINNGNTDGLPIVQQLKGLARQMFDALSAMIADERAELDEGLTSEMAMSYAMRSLAKSETAKQLIKSLHVPTGDGGNGGTTKEKTVNDQEVGKLVSTAVAEAIKKYDDDRRAEALNAAKIEETAKAADAATDARIRKQLAPLAKALGGDENATDIVGEVAKAYTKQAETATELAASVAEVEKAIGALVHATALRSGVEVPENATADEVLKAMLNKPAKPVANLRSVTKLEDTSTTTTDTSKSTDKGDPFASANLQARQIG